MPNGICPKCGVNPVLPKRSYCRECGNKWQNDYKKEHPQSRTEEQKDRQRFMARQRIANMAPDQRQAYYDRKQAAADARAERNPEIKIRINAQAVVRRANWPKEKIERQKKSHKAHYEKMQLRNDSGLCAYSVNCNEAPIGGLRFCLLHWCVQIRFAHTGRAKSTFTAQDMVDLWHRQGGKCAITALPITPGDNTTLDHVIPVARGGSGAIDNLRFILSAVNRLKWDFTDEEFKKIILECCPPLIEWAKRSQINV